MTEQDTDFLEIGFGQLGQYFQLDGVVAKRRFVLLHTEAVEPGCDVHARLPAAITSRAEFTLPGMKTAREESARLPQRSSLSGPSCDRESPRLALIALNHNFVR